MEIEPFGVEIWMGEFENHCDHNLAETCVASITVGELLELCGTDESELSKLLSMKMTYGAVEGSDELRQNIAKLHTSVEASNVVITHGAAGANALLYSALVSPGSHVVAIAPTYQQHYSIPESYGARVDVLQLRPEESYRPNLGELRAMVTDETSVIALTNPNNPTGSLIEEGSLRELLQIAESCDAYVICDEVYRGTDQVGPGISPSVADLSHRGISTGSMSKAFSLAGLRLGWIVAPPEVVEQVNVHRDYNTISVGLISDHLAALALSNADAVLERSRSITRRNLRILDDWVQSEPHVWYVKPEAGTTALVHYDLPVTSRRFCEELLAETGVLVMPGEAFEIEGAMRIGFANATEVLEVGLPRISAFLSKTAAGLSRSG